MRDSIRARRILEKFMTDKNELARGDLVITPADIRPEQRLALRRYRSWRRFHHGPRASPGPLFAGLSRYPDAVLVAGCQRSGTTMLTRLIARSKGFCDLALTEDAELDAALALCGEIDLPTNRRYCFQTTYLNGRFPEYRTIQHGQKLIWVLRNPFSVVYSMAYNWGRFALNELYEDCGIRHADPAQLRRSRRPWPLGLSQVEKACLAYAAKTSQVAEIKPLLARDRLLIVDYDQVVRNPSDWLPQIFLFIGEPYDASYSKGVTSASVHKADRLSRRERDLVTKLADPVYRRCLPLVTGASVSSR
jgi:hypothetical protein